MSQRSEIATLNFYNWEYLRGRGYLHFPFQVDLEPPFEFFKHKYKSTAPKKLDDGRVPSLFQKAIKLLQSPDSELEEEELEITPTTHSSFEKIGVLKLSGFPFSDSVQYAEFLNILAINSGTYSFELVGSKSEIAIQITCSYSNLVSTETLIRSYFPSIKIENGYTEFALNQEGSIAICDFGYSQEFMRPLRKFDAKGSDPYQHILTVFERLHDDETIIFQILFEGTSKPWSDSIRRSVRTTSGQSFFGDAPEMTALADEKTSDLLFAVVLRIAVQSSNYERIESVAQETIRHISYGSDSGYNQLIPLSNEGYAFEDHLNNLFERKTNRLGMIWSTNELANFVHFPSDRINSKLFLKSDTKSKAVPIQFIKGKYFLGLNLHEKVENPVFLTQEDKNKHIHIVGVTGVGKSNLLSQMILDDLEQGNGVAVFDPHGDLIDENILPRIPKSRIEDVIIFDPSYTESVVGFNLLQAHNDFEKIVLSSDLVEAFKSTATSWGDNMSAVLSNVINTFLESTQGGSIVELKRFLVDEGFRNTYLKTVNDPILLYYWKSEFPKMQKGITPLLTRIDVFLRHKVIRNIFSIKDGLDIESAMNSKKIILIKLSQGLIGFENANLLGTLLLSKLHQATFARQKLSETARQPFTIYLDEFQNFMTPSMTSMLEGSRKYQVAMVMAHQNIKQIKDSVILDSVLSNPYTRIAFRLGDEDARKLASGFFYFNEEDLANLPRGEAIARIGMSKQDFNVSVAKLSDTADMEVKNEIVKNSIEKYGISPEEIRAHIPSPNQSKADKKETQTETADLEEMVIEEEVSKKKIEASLIDELKEIEEKSERNKEHQYLQKLIRKMGQDRDYLSTLEKETKDGGRIDVVLERNNVRIAIEISVTNTPSYEVQNLKKCLKEGYAPVILISKNESHLASIEKLAHKEIDKKDLGLIQFIHPDELSKILDMVETKPEPKVEIVQGYRVTTEYDAEINHDSKSIKEHLAKLLFGKK